MVMPLVEENVFGFVDTYRMSSYLSSAQNFVTSFQHTGAVARSSLYAGYGSPMKKSGECSGNVVGTTASSTPSSDRSTMDVRWLLSTRRGYCCQSPSLTSDVRQ